MLYFKTVAYFEVSTGEFSLLFANMEEVAVNRRRNVEFTTRLKLTGNLVGSLFLPCATEEIFDFCVENRLTQTYQKRLILLNQEARENKKLEIWITGNYA